MIISLSIPENAQTKVRKGEIIDFNDPLYEVKSQKEVKINIAEKLKIKPENIFHYIVKIIGEQVKKKEVIAKKKGLFQTHKIFSDYQGIIKEINHQTGEILLAVDKNDQKIIHSNFKGVIKDIEKNQLKIKIENGEAFDLKDVNQDGGGEIFYFKDDSFFFSITEDQTRNKIILIENLKSHIEVKCEALGCGGFMILTGKFLTNLPSAKIKNIDDYRHITELRKRYIIFSKLDKLGIVYD